MKKLAIFSGAIIAGMLAFSPANAGPGNGVSATFYAGNGYVDTGYPTVTKAHYRHRKYRRRIRRHNRYYRNYNNHYRSYYRRSWRHYHPGWGYHDHRRRGGVGLYFNF